jgi:hypothetical protein
MFFPAKFNVNADEGEGFKDFWKTMDGINTRLDMLASSVGASTANTTLLSTASNYGIKEFHVAGPAPKCPYCIQYYGKSYRLGGFMPIFPAHPNCDHIWDF